MRGTILLIAGLFISTGCINLPGPESFDREYGSEYDHKPKGNVRMLLGDPNSNKPIRVGRTREQLHAILSTPNMLSADKLTESYGFYRRFGFVFWLIPLGHIWGDQTHYDRFDLVLLFDPQERLSAWEFGEDIVGFGRVPFPTDHKVRLKSSGTELYYIDHNKGWPTTQPP